ncbi:putative cellulose synthase (UDP-forming) [Helianthus annuus]|nr:putative cellulose synthase (UDP-forming) [Helianthus annuus]
MAKNTQDLYYLPLQETIVHNNKTARAIELVNLSLLVSVLVYRVVYFNDREQYLPWLLAFLCESWFTFNWIVAVCIKWNQCTTKTYPDRLLKRVSESKFPAVDIFVTTADSTLEPSIITMNTVLSLLAVDYPANKLALYLSDDGCSPLTFYSLVETTKFAKLWVPFCKKYNVQVRAPFRYFNTKATPLKNDSLEFQQEWKKIKKEYGDLYKKIDHAAQRPFPCDDDSDFGVFCGVHRSDHPTIIKVVSENKEGSPTDLPHVIYISREKSPKHRHHYKAGAMNVLARVSGVMTNAPLMLNVDCDMYANNPQFPQAFYDGLKDDPFGNQLADSFYLINGISSIQGTVYAGSNCFHRRKVIYGSSPNDSTKSDNISNEDLRKIFGKSTELKESAAQILSETNAKIENRSCPSNFIEAATHVASCSYEYGTYWGTQIGWLYGSATEDVLTGLNIHGRGWRSAITSPDPLAFLGCSATTYPSSLTQQKRWFTGLFEILFTDKNPLLLTIKGNIWFRQALAYYYCCLWAVRSVPELCYASLPAYCIIKDSHFLPKVNERAILIFMGIFVIYTLYAYWECKRIGISLRMWWNLQRMERVNTLTARLFAFVSIVILLINIMALVNGMLRLYKVDYSENWMGVSKLGLGEMFCSVWVLLCFWEYLKGLFRNGKYGIPSSTIWKSGALALLFVQICRR